MKRLIKKITPNFIIKLYHFSLSLIGAILYGFPSKKIKVIGVTGTSGKSTVVDLISKILKEGGLKVASISSVSFNIGDEEEENKLKMTMPGRTKIHKFLKKSVKAKCDVAVLEVTSEGIKQYRHKFINFNTAVFTNLSPEHIESHGGFEKYRKAKQKLFSATDDLHIINSDDENAKYFLKIPSKRKITYGIESGDLKAENIQLSLSGTEFSIKGVDFDLDLLGKFNVYNSLSAICVALSEGLDLEVCKKALKKVSGIPGRMEIVNKDPLIVVDYAHTPKALENVYKTLSEHNKGNMVCVLGSCGGGRDKWKRPVLGKLAADYCRRIIITNEDPYEEDPGKIIKEVSEGAKGRAEEIKDRRKAIHKAISLARKGDVVIITGKGSEPWMCVKGNKKIPWDDREIAKEEWKKTKNSPY